LSYDKTDVLTMSCANVLNKNTKLVSVAHLEIKITS